MIFRRNRFGDVVARQLDVFAEDETNGLLAELHDAKAVYDRAERDEAEERYGEYVDLVEEGSETLADIRDSFKRTLDEDAAERYEAEFNRAVKKYLPRFGLEIDLR